jgi:hypothetical protein
LLWPNEIHTCAVCGGSIDSPSDDTEAFVFKREGPGFGIGYAERFAHDETRGIPSNLEQFELPCRMTDYP